jgi:GNAT superfamily N-acetyltransferase
MTVALRAATAADLDAIHALHARALRGLGKAFYDAAVIEAFIAEVGTFDPVLIEDGTYFVVERDGALVGSGGWSARMPAYAAHAPNGQATARGRPKIRSVFVDPDATRSGVGRALMQRIERAIVDAGHGTSALTATLMGVPFYRALGYRGDEPVVLAMPGGRRFLALAMEKRLGSPSRLAA